MVGLKISIRDIYINQSRWLVGCCAWYPLIKYWSLISSLCLEPPPRTDMNSGLYISTISAEKSKHIITYHLHWVHAKVHVLVGVESSLDLCGCSSKLPRVYFFARNFPNRASACLSLCASACKSESFSSTVIFHHWAPLIKKRAVYLSAAPDNSCVVDDETNEKRKALFHFH